ncbi:MAG TPA: site-2 protease family protein [Candidatus Nitrosotalea sp.]|nr:site-2 protease family protein [Candidatus Nitrosotalea sp.]
MSQFPQPPGGPEPPYRPFQQYYEPVPPGPGRGRQGRRGFSGAVASGFMAVLAFLKYGGILLLKLPLLPTLLSLAVSFGAYAVFFGPGFAFGILLMIFIHEMGHVVEIRRQGMRATAPLFIPFMGAAIFQRSHPTNALRQAEIGIAGPIAGTIGATASFALYGATQNPLFLLWAYLGFFVNLFNLIPLGMLDGGWVLAVASKWFQVFGLIAMVLAVMFIGFSPIILIIAIIAIPTVIARFRNDQSPYYQSVPISARWAMGLAWLFLTGYLAYAALQAHDLLSGLVR